MNIQLTITKNYHEQASRYLWEGNTTGDNGFRLTSAGYDLSAILVLEDNLTNILVNLSVQKQTSVLLTVKLPKDTTITTAYKTMLQTKYTADGTISTITFE